MPWYKTGTVSVTQNSNAVIGTGTAFIANSQVGDGFRGPDGRWNEVTNIASNTALSISPNYQGPTATGGFYSIMPVQGYQKDLSDQVRAILNNYGDKLAALGTTGNYDILPVVKGGTGSTALDTDVVTEGETNKYFSASRVLQSVLTGLSTASSAVVAATDTILAAIGKLQAQVTARAMKGANGDITSISGLTTPLSIAQDGTGAVTATAAAAALGLGTGGAPQFTGLELSVAAPYMDFHFNNSTADYSVRMLCERVATLSFTHDFAPRSVYCRLGINGARGLNRYNFNWTGSAPIALITHLMGAVKELRAELNALKPAAESLTSE